MIDGLWIELRPFGGARMSFVNLNAATTITQHGNQLCVRVTGDRNEYMFDGTVKDLFAKAAETTAGFNLIGGEAS